MLWDMSVQQLLQDMSCYNCGTCPPNYVGHVPIYKQNGYLKIMIIYSIDGAMVHASPCTCIHVQARLCTHVSARACTYVHMHARAFTYYINVKKFQTET